MEFKKKNIKLFLVSGKARSGKGEIAEIIENYYGKDNCISISFGHYIKDYVKRISSWDGNEDTKPRKLLQQLGVELIKNKIDNKMFIKRIIDDINVFSYFYEVIIVDDVRLIDEIEDLKQKYNKSISIRVKRENIDNKLSDDEKKHVTENSLNNYDYFDYTVINDDYEKLKHQIINILKEV